MARKLSAEQYAAIALLALPKRGGMTYEEVATEVGVSRDTLRRWRNDDRFNDELKRTIMRNTIDRLPEIMESIPDHIINDGNAAMFRTLLQAHSLLTEKHEVSTKNEDNTDIDEMKAQIEAFKKRRENDGIESE